MDAHTASVARCLPEPRGVHSEGVMQPIREPGGGGGVGDHAGFLTFPGSCGPRPVCSRHLAIAESECQTEMKPVPVLAAWLSARSHGSHTGHGLCLQMVWESGCVVIVMLTPLTENGVRQCYHYWPGEGSNLYHIYEVPAWEGLGSAQARMAATGTMAFHAQEHAIMSPTMVAPSAGRTAVSVAAREQTTPDSHVQDPVPVGVGGPPSHADPPDKQATAVVLTVLLRGRPARSARQVHLVSEHTWCEDFLVRSFYLKNLQTNETRTVTQFHFLTWYDQGVPPSTRPLLDFRSDGAGRSGTYILIDMVLNKMAKGAKEIDIAATLEHLRDQRPGMVQTKEQFEFALTAVAEEVNAVLKALPQ
ncbi:Receptor-type tyrosine-protein phosphatase N2 [Tupaia chinensis]|uniref:Receptor-type tyrosine-protein phosphatase N2 n=1 Tax=Tupaia chinensis TaxID=246437 RepID=L9L411_TUPCH|nr:Receptor-type tyrosine-protein phosphatase N2 [Tupaia chinensis]